ncbi:DUF4215 domain-containing protein [Archangium gephyra]|uniref:myxococcus cysteine-rich repeat containing protein n=1 Tax=Archangium gephyra TaxID=48 RepID=UPI0035D4BF9B
MSTLLLSACGPASSDFAEAGSVQGPELTTREDFLTSCGDGTVGSMESCDDGNATSGDGCSSSCAVEPGYVCRIAGRACLPRACETFDSGGSTFLRNNFVEIGLNPNAAFGSQVAPPAGWHPRANASAPGTELGFVSDAESTGWTNYHGDFFTPGSPEETWGITVNGTSYHNSRSGPLTEIAGSFGASSCVAVGACGYRGGASVNWTSSSPVGGVSVKKSYTIVDGGAFIRIKVTLTNTTGSDLSNVYYMRSVDPDNDQTRFGSYVTTNTIVSQPGDSSSIAQVTASQTNGLVVSNLAYVADDARARVTHGGFAVRGADTVWNGTGLNTSGSVTADQAMSIAFKFASIPAGGTVSFLYAINLEPSASDALACLDDTDSDGVLDPNDPQPNNPGICGDSDADSCDDCSESTYNPAADGTDSDSDGQCDLGDADDDGDGVLDVDDREPTNRLVCGLDGDGDTCDDCGSGTRNAAADGADTDADGQCDAGDADDDNDGALDAADSDDANPNVCSDTDDDTCEDCGSGSYNPSEDGLDTDADGRCDAGDTDDDNDGVMDSDDSDKTDPWLCGDSDGDTCNDCAAGRFHPEADGLDTDRDGLCDAGDGDDDNDQVADADDAFSLDPNESVDTDGDGQGNNADTDDDADGLDDSLEARLGTNPLDGTTRVQINGGGCSSTGSPSATWSLFLTVMGLLWHSRRRHTRRIQTAILAVAALPSVASAQSLDVQNFKPAPGAHDLQVVQSPRVAGHLQWNAGLMLQYAHDPLHIGVTPENRVTHRLVNSLYTADFYGAVGLFGRFELGISVPVSLTSGDDASAIHPELGSGGTHGGLGHVRVVPKALLLERNGFSLGASVPVLLPGTASHYLASAGLAVQPSLLGEWRYRWVRVSGNLGVHLRPEAKLANFTVGHELLYKLGLEAPLSCGANPLRLQGTLFGTRALSRTGAAHPLEATVGLHHGLTRQWGLSVGAGMGLGDGYGTPAYRMFAGLSWTERTEAASRP